MLCVLCIFIVKSYSPAQTPFPMVTHCTPVAVQRGTTADVTVEGQMNFSGVASVLFEGVGLTAEVVPGPPPKDAKARVGSAKLKVTAAADAPLGPREFRLVSPLGLSTVGQLVVVTDPVVVETANNNTTATATLLPVPGVASGRIEAVEDVDTYKCHVEAGQTLSVEVYGARLQDKIHDLQKHLDPLLTLYDAQGRELAANDDYFFADPLLTYTAPSAGDYFIQVRDAKYDGDARWAYALLATTKPYAAHLFPMAANPEQQIVVEPISPTAVVPALPFTVPTELGLQPVQLPINGELTNPVAFVVSPLPQVAEHEPNDTPAQAQRLNIPCGVNGRIAKPRDLDYFTLKGEKGKAVRFEVRARRFGTPLQSPLDSILEVLDEKGRILAANDDDAATGKDALLTFTPPADGNYLLRVRDLNSKGGPAFVYYLEADYAKPDFSIRCDGARAHVGPGGRTAWYMHVVRQNGFAGPVKVDVEGLPAHVTASPLTIPPTMTQGLVVLTAEKDATVGAASVVRVVGTATRPDGSEIARTATANEEIYLPGGGRGRFDVKLHAVAVTAPTDILDIKVTPASLTIKPGEEVKLDVTVERRQDFDKGVVLDVSLRHLEQIIDTPLPPGVTVDYNKSKYLLGGASQGHIVLKAAPDAAPVENVPISVVGYVSINFVVKIGYSSATVPVTVQKKD
jgi:hypothetical protein